MPTQKLSTKSVHLHHESDCAKIAEMFADHVDAAHLDLITDLDENFFTNSNQLVQEVAEKVNVFIAGKLKRYVDLLARMHTHYVAAVESSEGMRQKVEAADEKLRLALETTATSESMFEHLNKSLEEAWRTADAVEYREAVMKDQLTSLIPKEQAERRTLIENAGNTTDDKLRTLVFRERDRVTSELKEYQKRLEINRFYADSLEHIVESSRDTINKLSSQIAKADVSKKMQDLKQNAIQESLSDKVAYLQKELDCAKNWHKDLQLTEVNYHACQKKNETLQALVDRMEHEHFIMQTNVSRIDEVKVKLQLRNTNLEETIKQTRRDLKHLDANYHNAMSELKKRDHEQGLMKRKFQQLGHKNADQLEKITTMQNLMLKLEKKLTNTIVEFNELMHLKDETTRQKEKLNQETVRLGDLVGSLKHDATVRETGMHILKTDLERANKMLDEKDQLVQKLNREKVDLQQETNRLNENIQVLEDNLHKRTEEVTLLRERLTLRQNEYISMKKQMEQAHLKKIALQKNLGLCTRERQTMQNVNAKMTHQINQMSSEIAGNEKQLNEMKCRLEQLHNTIKQKQTEVQAAELATQRTRTKLKEMKILYEQAQHTIEADEKRFTVIAHNLDETVKEKNLVGMQMVRRNDEVRLMRERLTMMQHALDQGTTQYNQRLDDIRLLKLEIKNLRMSHDCMRRAVESTANMRREVVRLERQLNRERLRVNAFTAELSRPCRIHRWRVLLGKDPGKLELMRKIQMLLKRNVRLNVERVNMEKKAQDVQQLYDTLKNKLKLMPDISVVHQLSKQQRINRNQSRKLKAFKAELTINEIDLQTRDCIIDRYQQTLKEYAATNNSYSNSPETPGFDFAYNRITNARVIRQTTSTQGFDLQKKESNSTWYAD